MNIEEEIFKRTHVDIKRLIEYGFKQEDNYYTFSKKFMNDNFRADIVFNKNGKIFGKVFDLGTNEEYTNIRIKTKSGSFINNVCELYKDILKDIKNKCFNNDYFISSQANRITNYIINEYGDEPEFLWKKYPGYGVFRNKKNNKWYGIIMNINKSKIDNETEEIEIIDIKLNEDTISTLINQKGYYEGYHMNKKNWLTIILDDTISDEEIIKFIKKSYNMVNDQI